jgi:hypothetical protein
VVKKETAMSTQKKSQKSTSNKEKSQKSTGTTLTFSGVLSGQIDMADKNYKLSVTDNYGNKYNVRITLTSEKKEIETFMICWEGGRQVPC